VTKLLTPEEMAVALDTTPEHVIGLVKDGKLRFVNVGRGRKRPRYRFTPEDLAEFIASNRAREEAKCLFSRGRVHRSTNSTLGSKVIGLEALRKQRTDAKLKK
jgi:excisionase family DNA binding protein